MSSTSLDRIRFVCISDTHNLTPNLPSGDVLIHAGDLTNQGGLSELRKALEWIEGLDFQAKIVVAGNHDITLDKPFYTQYGSYFHNQAPQDPDQCRRLFKKSSILYLDHEAATVILEVPDGNEVCGHVHEGRGAETVKWDLTTPNTKYKEKATIHWEDSTQGTKKLFKVNVSGTTEEDEDSLKRSSRTQFAVRKLPANMTSFQPFPDHEKGGNPISAEVQEMPSFSQGTFGQGGREESGSFNKAALGGRMDRIETCVVNAAIVGSNYPHKGGKKINKPIVVDILLPSYKNDKNAATGTDMG
ncbi:putative ser thr protein phosphatase [Phaeomoniella chlamydospora]|uniref:Putative ser thr protein phosphatase n=1 Tax=Phaeomoniella chlamydospora TaxID=158046 RepID=A0A0G2ERM5_PHACM|nr:putative ser thr protein phosphatase [Phaeomoniella chlamydospora]